jgi:ketosteroid isomerase-like protein
MTARREGERMTTIPSSTFDTGALRRAYSSRDAAALLSLYAPDASIELGDAPNTPSHPRRIDGHDAIRAHFEDVFGRDMTHTIDIVAAGEDAVGYSLRCQYADGMRVVCAGTAALRDGRIVREVGVQAWDA